MKVHSIEREIEVVTHIIGQLNKCLVIYHKSKMFDEFRATLNDIQICKTELNKLIAKKNAESGEAKDVSKVQ